MPQNFIPCDRDQQMLMPTDMREWLPEDHLVWFVIDAVKQLDLSAFYARHRDDGHGRAAYDPAMMVTLLLYAYAVGVRSAREIERRCVDDVAFRVITDGHRVDHATICRFRTNHRAPLSELFVSVLGLCAKAAMVRPGVVAVDGTKLAANAAQSRNLTREQLEEIARQVFEEAERIDAEEDELYGDKRGDEIPEHLIDQADRIEWLQQQLEEQQRVAGEATKKGRSRGKARINTTDPDSRLQKTPDGYFQGYNAQLAVTEDQIIVAADVCSDNTDDAQLEPMITQAKDNLGATSEQEPIGTVVADAGYFNEDNAVLDLGVDLLVTPVASRNLGEAVANRTEPVEIDEVERRKMQELYDARQERARRRDVVMAAYADSQLTRTEAAQALAVPVEYISYMQWHLETRDRLPKGRVGPPPPRPSGREVMLERFAQPGARDTYAMRGRSIEPVFGQLKEARDVRRLLHRGLPACRCEWRMVTAAHNLRKLWGRAARDLALIPGRLFSRFGAVPA